MEPTPNAMPDSRNTATHLVDRLVESREGLDRTAESLQPLAVLARGRGLWRRLITGELIGHAAHPFLTDVPIGLFTSATVLDLAGGADAAGSARKMVGWGLASAPAAAVSGLAEYAA